MNKSGIHQLPICRMCLQDIVKPSWGLHIESSEDTRQKLTSCIPELDLQLLPNGIICNDCYDAIDSFNEFKGKCLQFEQLIRKHIQTQQINVDYGEVVQLYQMESDDPDIKIEYEELEMPDIKLEVLETEVACSPDVLNNIKKIAKSITNPNDDFERPCENSSGALNNQRAIVQNEMRILIQEKPFQCSICEYRYNSENNLRMHMKTHGTEKPFQCPTCGYQTKSKASLEKHLLIHGNTAKLFRCSACNYQTNWKICLQKHTQIHSVENPFKCSLCDYSASSKESLEKHTKVHSNEKPIKCSFCEYECNNKTNLKMHMQIHSVGKTFKCLHCDYRTNWKGGLQKHMEIHTSGQRDTYLSI